MRRKPDPIEREDVDAVHAALLDIRILLTDIRNILREDDDEEGTD